MHTLEVRFGQQVFQAEFNSRVIIVDDDSGVGKTVLYKTVKNYPGNRAKINSDLSVVAVDTIYSVKEATDKMIIIDEDSECLHSENVDETINFILETNNVFIILSRENKFSRLAYGVDSIYKIVRNNKVCKIVQKYDRFYKNNSLESIKSIAIEDSTTGCKFFSKLIADCESFHGKDNFEKALEHHNTLQDLIVIDRVGFGSCVKDFMQVWNGQTQILDYDSFEGLLLEALREDYDIGYDVDEENMLTSKLHAILPQYGKSENCDCLINCKQCATCLHHNELLNSRAVLNRTKFKDYVRF